MNKVILMGRLTGDPIASKTKEGVAVTRFRLAVDRRGRRQEGRQNADFVPLTVWDKLGEFAAQRLKKGTRIVVEARLASGEYVKDGQKVYTLDVVAESIEFAESKTTEQARQQQQQAVEDQSGGVEDEGGLEGDGLPF